MPITLSAPPGLVLLSRGGLSTDKGISISWLVKMILTSGDLEKTEADFRRFRRNPENPPVLGRCSLGYSGENQSGIRQFNIQRKERGGYRVHSSLRNHTFHLYERHSSLKIQP